MKKIYLLLSLLAVAYSSFSQTTNTFPPNGSAGIGTTSPVSTLQVGGTTGNNFITLSGGYTGSSYGINYSFSTPGTNIYAQNLFDYDNRATRGLQFNSLSSYGFSFNNISTTGAFLNNLITIQGSGKVGIGTAAPGTILDAVASSGNGGIRSISTAALGSGSGGGLLAISSITPTASAQRLGFLGFGSVSTGTTYKYASSVSAFAAEAWDSVGNGSYLALSTTPKRSPNIVERMRIDDAGNVSIGTTDPKGYKLAINGKTIATEMWVKNLIDWPDYVFKTSYHLPALNEVKTYIDANHHLPDVPTEKDVKQNGLNLGEMNKVLLQKVEELTLYMIDLNKQLKAQRKEIEELKAKH